MHNHFWIPSEHENYDRCLECGSLHNRIPFPRENYLDNYWNGATRSDLASQRYNCEVFVNERGESKVQAVLKYCIGESILEVACAPGSFLYAAKLAGHFSVGIEPDKNYCTEISDYSQCDDVICGFFEDIPVNQLHGPWSNIVAMDLLEHLEEPEMFIEKAMELLELEGKLILMLPLADTCREQDYHPEHINLFSRKFIEEWLAPTVIEEWIPGHTIVVASKISYLGYSCVGFNSDRKLIEEI